MIKYSISTFKTTNWIIYLAVFLVLTVLNQAPCYAQYGPSYTIYYVSKNGDNSDGSSWTKAFNELDQIPWSQISPRDKVILDGGVKRMIYRKPLTVNSSGNHYGRISITKSTDIGHNGQVVIAPSSKVDAITISGNSIEIKGERKSGILVWGARIGLNILQNGPISSHVSNLEIAACRKAGVYVKGGHYYTGLEKLIIHDNKTNLLAEGGSYPGTAALNNCWIFNNYYRKNSDGIKFFGSTSSAPVPGIRMTKCILGPGLRDGINNPTPAVPTLKDCLIINCTRNNISSPSIGLEHVTSFMTKRNPRNMSHSCIKLRPDSLPYLAPRSSIKKSIFYGGLVEIPSTIQYPGGGPTIPLPILVEENTQYRTTGNTTVLSNQMNNPRFRSRVGKVRSRTPIRILKRLDFSLKESSPATGTGSSLTSVSQLLNSFNN